MAWMRFFSVKNIGTVNDVVVAMDQELEGSSSGVLIHNHCSLCEN